MILLSHLSYPFLGFLLLAKLFGIGYSSKELLLLMVFSILPDLDFFYHALKRGGWQEYTLKHHKWVSHWPIVYSPLIAAAFIYPEKGVIIACAAVYFHLLLDTFASGDGIMWLYPFSKKFYNFFSEGYKDKHGHAWFKAYAERRLYKIDLISYTTLLIVLARMLK